MPTDRHVVGKGVEVNWNEGLHSRLGDKLHRSTKGSSKSAAIFSDSIALVCMRLF